jgi:hypothetical protein
MRVFLATAAMCVVLCGGAAAQEPASDLNQLRVLVRVGDSLVVTDTAGQRAQGRVVQLDASTLVLDQGNQAQRRFDGPSTIAVIEKRGGDSLKNGALLGLIIGGGVGIWGGIAEGNWNQENPGYSVAGPARLALTYGLVIGGLGAAIGTGIDAMIRGRHVIFSKTTVSLSPRFDHHQKGLVLTVRR